MKLFSLQSIFISVWLFASCLLLADKASTVETAASIYATMSHEFINKLNTNSTAISLNIPPYLTFLCKQVEEELKESPEQPIIADLQTVKEMNIIQGDYLRYLPRHTHAATAELIKILSLPTNNKEELLKRQELLNYLKNNQELGDKLTILFNELQIIEKEILELSLPTSRGGQQGKNLFKSTPLSPNNVYSYATSLLIPSLAVPLQMTFMRSSYIGNAQLLTQLFQKSFFPNQAEMTGKIGALFILSLSTLSLPKVIHNSFTAVRLIASIQDHLKPIAYYIKKIQELNEIVKNDSHLSEFFNLKKFEQLLQPAESVGKEFVELILSSTFEGESSYFSSHERTIKALKLWIEHPEIQKIFTESLTTMGKIDAFNALAQYSNTSSQQHTFAQYVPDDQSPQFVIKNFTHPNIINSRKNNIELGSADTSKDAVVTGINRGGKSTITRAALLDIWLALTTTLVPAEELTTTIFDKITLAANISDVEQDLSKYQAEVQRFANQYLFEKNNPKLKSLLVCDEPLSGTNAQQSEYALKEILTLMHVNPNAMHIAITHFPALTELPGYTQYCVKGIKQADGLYKPTYQLKKGSSTQNDAIAMLIKAGFPISLPATYTPHALEKFDQFL